MEKQNISIGYFFLVAASVVIVLAGIKTASVIVVPFLLSLFLATILSPFYLWLKKLGLGDLLPLIIIIVVLLVVIGSMITLIGNSVQDFSHNVPMYEIKLRNDMGIFAEQIGKWGIHIPKQDFLDMFQTSSLIRYIATTLRSLGSLLTNSLMIILTVTFMLMEISQFTSKIEMSNSNSLARLIEISDKIKHYILLKALTSAATSMAVLILLKAFDIHYAGLWAVLAFLLNFIPNIGSIIAAIPAILMALVQYTPITALYITVGYLVINISIGSILEPKILGRGLGLSTLVVFLSLIFWGWLLGPVGMLLSVPLTIMIKIALYAQPNTKWLAILLDSGSDIRKSYNRA